MPDPTETPVSATESENKKITRKPFGWRNQKRRAMQVKNQLSDIKKAKQETDSKLQQKEDQLLATEQRANQAEQLIGIDYLTGLPNKKRFEEDLQRKFAEAKRSGEDLYVIFADIDLFKAVNDTEGHPKGDEILRAFGEIGQRETEPFARWGGEEFAQVITSHNQELKIQDIAKIISRYQYNFGDASERILQRRLTLSFGVAKMALGESPDDLVKRADKAVYIAKETGRNKAVYIGANLETPDEPRVIEFLTRTEIESS